MTWTAPAGRGKRARLAPTVALVGLVGMCGCAFGQTMRLIQLMPYATPVEYVEVGRLVPASENYLIPLGPGRSYWFDGSDGSRWSATQLLAVSNVRIVIWRDGEGLVNASGTRERLTHLSGPREVKRGWYGRVIEQQPGGAGRTELTLEDGRRFVTASRVRAMRTPFDVVLSEDYAQIFLMGTGDRLAIERQLPL